MTRQKILVTFIFLFIGFLGYADNPTGSVEQNKPIIINFEYSLKEGVTSAYIMICDIYGNLKSTIVCPYEDNTVSADLSGLNNGIYVATLIVDGITKDTKQIIVQK